MTDDHFFDGGRTADGRIILSVRRKPRVPIETSLGTFEDVLDAKSACSICGGDCYVMGHRNFAAAPSRIEGAKADVCYHCTAPTPGLRPWGNDANVTYRDARIIADATAMARAIDREAKHVRR